MGFRQIEDELRKLWRRVRAIEPVSRAYDGHNLAIPGTVSAAGRILATEEYADSAATNAAAALRAELQETDTGWVDVDIRPGFGTTRSGERPQVRRIGNKTTIRGVWSSAGITATTAAYQIGDLPAAEFYPPSNFDSTCRIVAHGPFPQNNGMVYVDSAGVITLRTGDLLGGYYAVSESGWLND